MVKPLNTFFSRVESPMIQNLGMLHCGLKLYKSYMYINDDPRLTLAYFAARSNLVAHAFEWGKTVTKSNGKHLKQMTKLAE